MCCPEPVRPFCELPCCKGCFACTTQALRATQELHANIAAEHRAMHEFYATWHAIVTPHQDIRGELAAWPYGVSELRLIRVLGAADCWSGPL